MVVCTIVCRQVEEIDEVGLTWRDVCLHIPVIKKPKCLGQFNLLDSVLGRRRREATGSQREATGRRRRQANSSGIEGNWEDWGDEGEWEEEEGWEEGEVEEVDAECEGVEAPDLSNASWEDLTRIKAIMDEGGFSLDLGDHPSFHPAVHSRPFIQPFVRISALPSAHPSTRSSAGHHPIQPG